MASTVRVARGTRDFLSTQVTRRTRVLRVIREVFERFGFEPLETPALENLSTLTGKYGEDGEQLVYKVQNLRSATRGEEPALGLRYDLTVPLARVVSTHAEELPLPYKRYQVQTVWRADRPQRGRFREFTQCDVDIVGAVGAIADAELIAVAHFALDALRLRDTVFRVNSRKLLRGLVEVSEVAEPLQASVLLALDKLAKVGPTGVADELGERGLGRSSVSTILEFVEQCVDEGGLMRAKQLLASSASGAEGVAEVEAVLRVAADVGVPPERMMFDPSLARGLASSRRPMPTMRAFAAERRVVR